TAHFKLTYPPTRGFDERIWLTSQLRPCGGDAHPGGFNTVGTRTPFALGDGFIKLESEHEEANGELSLMRHFRYGPLLTETSFYPLGPPVLVLISFAPNPSNIKNFTTASDGSTQAPVRDWFRVDGSDLCIGVDIQSLGYANGTDGTNATIAVQYSGGD
ncbi:17223_t:CDS:2, partial [Acaulospora colombiana]